MGVLTGFVWILWPRVAKGTCRSFWTLDLVKHGRTGEVKDDGNHGKERGEIGYGR